MTHEATGHWDGGAFIPDPTDAPGARSVEATERLTRPPMTPEQEQQEREAFARMMERSRKSMERVRTSGVDGRPDSDIGEPAGPSDIGIRASYISGNAQFINPPMYPLIGDGAIDVPLDTVQPQFIGQAARQTWQSVLTVLPYARIHGVPGESEILPGLSGPLNPEERVALQQLLDAEAMP